MLRINDAGFALLFCLSFALRFGALKIFGFGDFKCCGKF